MKYKYHVKRNNIFDKYKKEILSYTIIVSAIIIVGKIFNIFVFDLLFYFLLLPILIIEIILTTIILFLINKETKNKIKNIPLKKDLLNKTKITDEISYCSFLNDYFSINKKILKLMKISLFRFIYNSNEIDNLKMKIDFNSLRSINMMFYYGGEYTISRNIENITKIFVNNYLLKKRTNIY